MPVQAITNLTTATQWKTLLNRELKCSNPVIVSLKEHQEIDSVDKLYELEDSDWDTISKQCLQPPMGDPVIIPVMTLKHLKASSITPPTYSNASLFFLFLFSSLYDQYSNRLTTQQPTINPNCTIVPNKGK